MLISISLLLLNLVLLLVWIGKGMNEGKSPASVVQSVAEGLHAVDGAYALEATPQKTLDHLQVWAMLMDESGQVIWRHHVPDDLPNRYSVTDVAKFSLRYLNDYPVFVWAHQAGLVVIGYPQGSLAKYQHILPTRWVENLPLRALSLLIGNIVLALLVSLLIGSRLVRSIRPLTRAIHALAKDQPAYVEPKGILEHLARSVNHAADLLRRKNDALKARDEARSNWIAGISHDIRTPLSMVLGYASELEEDGRISDQQRGHAGVIRRQAEKLRSLVSDLNLVSMLEYDMQPLVPKPVRLAALARQIASDMLNNGLDPRYRLEIDELNENAQVMADERLLLRAMSNLVHNSIKHNSDGCEIRLRTTLDTDACTCSFFVSDDGRGKARSELSELLELPYSSKRKRPGSHEHGLGLPMTARIAKAHQGSLNLSSDVGEGWTAEIRLPALM
ncbi:HAMP domain-containing sensor histidine kinase [Paenibacillus hodogayensis]